jgi:hypothetical protein
VADYSEEIETARELVAEFGGDMVIKVIAPVDEFGRKTVADKVVTVKAVMYEAGRSGLVKSSNIEIMQGDKAVIFADIGALVSAGITDNLEKRDFYIEAGGVSYKKTHCDLLCVDGTSHILYQAIVRG